MLPQYLHDAGMFHMQRIIKSRGAPETNVSAQKDRPQRLFHKNASRRSKNLHFVGGVDGDIPTYQSLNDVNVTINCCQMQRSQTLPARKVKQRDMLTHRHAVLSLNHNKKGTRTCSVR
jgi:hypothetical protein